MKDYPAGLAQLGAALAAFVMLPGCNRSLVERVQEPAPLVRVHAVEAKRGAITRFVTLPGQIKPYQEATLYAKVAGYLKTIKVDKGDRVEAGALVAEIEIPELNADRSKYKAEEEVAALDYQRLSESQTKAPDLVMPQAVDDARGKLQIAKANLERAETLLNYARIVAPFSGLITRRMLDPGAFVPAATSGNPAQSAAIVTLTDFHRVRVQVAVPEVEASLVSTDQPVRLTVEGLPGRTFRGAVTRFSYALDEVNRTMLAEIELPNPDSMLRPGMYATVQIGVECRPEALLLPKDAVGTEKAGPYVYILAENKARKTRVQTGFKDEAWVEVVSGLNLGQRVILIDNQPLNDGQAVRVLEGE